MNYRELEAIRIAASPETEKLLKLIDEMLGVLRDICGNYSIVEIFPESIYDRADDIVDRFDKLEPIE